MLGQLKGKGKSEKAARELLALEVSEIREIAEKLFARLDQRIKDLKTAEARIDRKIAKLEKLLGAAEGPETAAETAPQARLREIRAMAKKGLNVDEIAGILDMPRGEVELILSLNR